MISEIQVCHIKGTVDLGNKTYARAGIEEVIFKSEDCASQFVKTLNEIIGDDMYLKELFNKSPHSIFNDKNRVYYLSSGGFYMTGIYTKIEISMKNRSCL